MAAQILTDLGVHNARRLLTVTTRIKAYGQLEDYGIEIDAKSLQQKIEPQPNDNIDYLRTKQRKDGAYC